MKLIETGEDCDRCLSVPSITDDLKAVVGRGDAAKRFFRLDEEAHVAVVGREVKSVIRAALCSIHAYAAFNFDFLLERVFLMVMIDVPAESNEKLVNKV